MGNRRYIITSLLLCFMVFHAFPFTNHAYANGAAAALGLGGLEFVEETDISIEKEELKITPGRVSVKYIFRNNTDKDKKVLIAFPLPPFDNDWQFTGLPEDFTVMVAGKQLDTKAEYRAFLGNRYNEVTDLLNHYGIPIFGTGVDKITEIMNSLDEESRGKLQRKGCFSRIWDREGVKILRWRPLWSVETKFYWEQDFPASQLTELSVSYEPLRGGMDGFSLGQVRDMKGTKSKPCSSGESAWIESVLKEHPGYEPFEILLRNNFVKYILSSGSYWSGPIKEFDLVVTGAEFSGVCFDTEIDGEIIRVDNSTVKVHINNFEPNGNVSAHFYGSAEAVKGGFQEI